MVQAAQSSVNAYEYGYGWDDDADDGCIAHYFVYRGDTLSRIAARYGVSVYAIARANGIPNINRIYPGQYFCIPGHDRYHDGYDDQYHRHYDDDEGYGHKGYEEEDDYGYYGGYDSGYYGHKHHDDYGDHQYGDYKHGYSAAAYGPVEKEYADPGYYRTSGGHTGVCYYPDPRYNADDAEFYEEDERPDCS
ncbi:MAG: LysM domain-containing protein [Caldilinea sp. CFX5]|nr:LysM domain-containing protein [Caldilinea sp. CFX5]